ncbi:MAG: uroporphyrinogen-III synthase [Acidocella sp.]|nr:uroporphyrinogen-III synthase [Acidocella sp.]
MKLLVTRPEPGATATAARLAAMGYEPVVLPCLTIRATTPRLPEHPAALVITSGQAIPALPATLHNTPAFCVGDATAAKLRQAGFTRVESASGNAGDLAKLVTARRLKGLHLLAVGERHGLALAKTLREAGIPVLRRKVYAVTPARHLPESLAAALASGKIPGALFYSAETARAFARLNPPGTATMTAYALSETIATALQDLPWAQIRAAVAPTEADLMALLA